MNVFRGLCMGCADVVPGVSGGTIALILGIYERLVTAISHFDATFAARVRSRAWRSAAQHIELQFLVTLGFGIGCGVVAMTLLINRLLTSPDSRALTLAVFFGMILASALLIARTIRPTSTGHAIVCALLGLLGAAVAWWVSVLPQAAGSAGEPSLLWYFVCGSIAICAMILPGISGAMILLVLGVYIHLTEIPHQLLAGEQLGHNLLVLIVFGSGCAISLVLFSKVLRWLLVNFHSPTMALLCGFMFGALRKLWPFQHDLTPEVEKYKYKVFEAVWPDTWNAQVVAVIAACAVAAVAVLVVDVVVRRSRTSLRP